jgi:di/tricarboxylate transporter
MDLLIVSGILIISLYLFVTEKISVALTALGIMISLVLFQILTPKESVAGLAHPAVITVGSMFLISKGLVRTGAVEHIARRVIKISKGNQALALIFVLSIVAMASAFINNTPVVVLFIPVVMTMCCEFDMSPSTFLIPLSYASILAGTCTLIGTSTNIIVSDLSAQYGFGELSMFELSLVGIPIAVAGIVFLILTAPRFLPALSNPVCQIRERQNRRYLAELKIPRGSSLIGKDPATIFKGRYPDLEILELIRYSHIFHPARDSVEIAADDLLLVKGSVNDLIEVINGKDTELSSSEKDLSFDAGKKDAIVVELVISPQSAFLGQRLLETALFKDSDIHVIAIKRSSLHFTEKQFHDVRLKIGDIILVWCYGDKLATMRSGNDYLIIEDVYEDIVHKRKTWIAAIIFTGMILAVTSGFTDIMTGALTAAFFMILTGCIQMRDAYRALQGDVLLLIAGTIALGAAMQKTGASQYYADLFLSIVSVYSPTVVLGSIILLTSISTHLLSNNATAVLIFPVAVATATGMGVDPKPFIIGICFGASACYATPIGYQTNLLVYGPGGYRFGDYLRLGIPLNVLVLVSGTILIPFVWAF